MTTTATSTTPVRHRSLGDHTWQDQAVCHPTEYNPVDPETFFPGPEDTDRIATAKALCAQCPVARACLDAALEVGDTHGVRGGLTQEEREPLHTRIAERLDHSRVNATLAGRDIHLTKAERRAVVLAGYRQDIPVERLARLLKITDEHALKLYREIRRAIRHRQIAEDAAHTARTGDSNDQLGRDDFGTAA
ncbi:WhiB family transcriptional regulator [Streptomyces sp. BE20]|uniref:WhiB family transcriptional regulator n=1 Tax=Streptomyces sp. BE20 TaxID=3002525 RepID=UPI002E77FE8F|nr:WhiB family transcriptional regulator [Streptomyces sp. BE20]MEE1825344.1 WhiB family transcriptional regulator [Streptomyces sp. BE20]